VQPNLFVLSAARVESHQIEWQESKLIDGRIFTATNSPKVILFKPMPQPEGSVFLIVVGVCPHAPTNFAIAIKLLD